MKAYRIKNFVKYYENHASKQVKRPSWVAIPINFDSDGFAEIMEESNGPAIYAVWICLIGVAMIGRLPEQRHGILDRKSGQHPHDIRTISRKVRIKESLVKLALDFLVESVGWVEIIDFESKEPLPDTIRTPSGDDTEGREGKESKEGKGRGSKERQSVRVDYSTIFEKWWSLYPNKTGKIDAFKEFKKALKLTTEETLFTGVEVYCESEKVKRGFIKDPDNWLKGGHWDDRPSEIVPQSSNPESWRDNFK